MARRAPGPTVPALLLVALAGLVATVVTVAVTAHSTTLADPVASAVVRGFDVASWIGVGLVTWHRRPEIRLGPLMIAVGAMFSAGTLMALASPAAFLVGRVAWALLPLLLLVTFLSFPSGRIEARGSRRLIAVAAAWLAAVWVPLILGGHSLPVGGALARCDGPCPENPLQALSLGDAEAALERLARLSTALVLLAVAVVMLARLARSTPLSRRMLVLPLGCVAATALFMAAGNVLDAAGVRERAVDVAFWLGSLAAATFPYAFLLGQARGRLFGADALHRAVLELAPHERRRDVRDVLAQALADPMLELCFWVPTIDGYVDRAGHPVHLDDVAPRAATPIGVDGRPVAAILHDPALDESPGLVEAAGNAALLALENARLEAELRASIEELRASRARIVSIGAAERRRLERDLHDSAQNRLVALRIRLGLAEERAAEADPELAASLAALGDEAQDALDNVRRVAQGIYPTVLTSRGLVDALALEAETAALPARLVAGDIGRSTPEAESAAYFVCCEAIQTAAKHAGPGASATIRLRRHGEELAFSVFDDGAGFDPRATPAGFGRTAMHDRVGAVGGALTLHASPGRGTLVSGRIRWPAR
ncbi:MAG TPA: histidine kinase [Solirubrobacteraceae bacterium]|nr:histidine kinase [Solirubrobacteraceae bacterium]